MCTPNIFELSCAAPMAAHNDAGAPMLSAHTRPTVRTASAPIRGYAAPFRAGRQFSARRRPVAAQSRK
jgi:hypothetical protein